MQMFAEPFNGQNYNRQNFIGQNWCCKRCQTSNLPQWNRCNNCQVHKNAQDREKKMVKFPPGGWECSKCFNYNFSGRWFCKRCKKTKGDEDKLGMPKHLISMQEQLETEHAPEAIPLANDCETYENIVSVAPVELTPSSSYMSKMDHFISTQNFISEEKKRKELKTETLKKKA